MTKRSKGPRLAPPTKTILIVLDGARSVLVRGLYISRVRRFFRFAVTTLRFALEARQILPIKNNGHPGKRIVIQPIHIDSPKMPTYFAMAALLRRNGHYPILLIDDGCFSHRDTHRAKVESLDDISNERCAIQRRRPLAHAVLWLAMLISGQFEARTLSNLYHIAKRRSDAEYGLPSTTDIAMYKKASHHRYFGGWTYDPQNRAHTRYEEWSHENIMLGWHVLHVLNTEAPVDRTLIFDGFYSVSGGFLLGSYKLGIESRYFQPMNVMNEPYYDRYIGISTTLPYPLDQADNEWMVFRTTGRDSKLTKQARSSIRDRLAKAQRAPHDRSLANAIVNTRMRYTYCVAMFPNLPWDANSELRDTIFTGLHDWIQATITWAYQERWMVIVREHPQTPDSYHIDDSLLDSFEEEHPGVLKQDHVFSIRGNQTLGSYWLAREVADVSTVINGTLGVEIPFLGRSIVFAGRSPYANKGIGVLPKNPSGYYAELKRCAIEGPRTHCDTIKEQSLQVAAFHNFYRLHLFPFFPHTPLAHEKTNTMGSTRRTRRSRRRILDSPAIVRTINVLSG